MRTSSRCLACTSTSKVREIVDSATASSLLIPSKSSDNIFHLPRAICIDLSGDGMVLVVLNLMLLNSVRPSFTLRMPHIPTPSVPVPGKRHVRQRQDWSLRSLRHHVLWPLLHTFPHCEGVPLSHMGSDHGHQSNPSLR